jgi:hypothetical protein
METSGFMNVHEAVTTPHETMVAELLREWKRKEPRSLRRSHG